MREGRNQRENESGELRQQRKIERKKINHLKEVGQGEFWLMSHCHWARREREYGGGIQVVGSWSSNGTGGRRD